MNAPTITEPGYLGANQVINVPVALTAKNSAASIAKKFGISVQHLLDANGGKLTPNTTIQVPYAVGYGATWDSIAAQAGIGINHLQGNNPNATIVPSNIPGTSTNNPTGPSETKLINQLSGPNRDAYQALNTLFSGYGLGSLSKYILEYVTQGYSQDTISLMLQNTPAYIQRFAGNGERAQKGLAILSPADYMSLEDSYYQIVQSAGLPQGFYDSPKDWTTWIGNDVSPSEIQTRVNMAQVATQSAPPDLVQALGVMGVPTTALTAYFLDDKNALPMIQQSYNSAQIGASALRNGLAMDPTRAATFAQMGISVAQANTAYQQIGQTLPTLSQLGTIYANQSGHTTPYTQQTAENNLLMGNAQAALQTQKLVDTEKATFSGSSGVGTAALATAPPPTGGGKY
jgi:hypothetical protein